ncbi:hypothetical protein JAAARDRAFT_37190 [Jaapia argillacea MUCL 33604]|uniref:Uncharacterized protein n=1 Tax=Jaapia argillacea MUCL 33604 TaxID=933084 RepID=A0A067PWW1_9AGAM|nr:hypothetical protein JAAARDRAFT_37190 [Jaapia argillacea MUCL 33604]
MAKEDILREWREEWKRSPHQGRYAPSNRIPPSFKLRDHFEYLRREVYGRVTQCRVGHAFIGEYYAQFNIPEPVDCPCGAGYQTREHGIDALSSFIMESGAFTKTGELRGGPQELPRYEEEPDVDLSDDDPEDED